MPFAQVYAPAGVLSLEQKRAMVKGITEVMVRWRGSRPAPCPM
jgi:phenylpyruvate tautomerase PptA (4-oxalocrotonate tautomerase family)